MKEFPVFVPFGGEHLAAVVTVPEGEPAGLALLLTGTGAPRSHRFGIWTRAARKLAEGGVASIRLDCLGIGDSSGIVREFRFSEPPADQAEAAARFAMRATGQARFVVVGNCLGSRAALHVAGSVPECVGAACIRAPLLDPGRAAAIRKRARGWRIAASPRRRALLRRLASPVLRRGRRRRIGTGVGASFARATEHGRVLFLYSTEDHTYNELVRAQLDAWAEGLSPSQRERFELRLLPEGPLKGFESLRIQEVVIETVTDWVLEGFGVTPTRSASGGAGNRAGSRSALRR